MNIANKDFNLLYLFTVLYEERSLSRAAVRMNLSQPALSHKLKKLRHEFADTLFVRTGHGLAPTPKAVSMAQHICALVKSLERFYVEAHDDNFLARDDTITLYTTDFIEFMLLPQLIPLLQAQAPNVRLVTRNTGGQLPLKALENGDCDIAIAGFYQHLPEHFFRQGLAAYEFVVLSDQANTSWGQAQTLANFTACQHVVTTLSGDLRGIVDSALRDCGQQRQVVAGAASFFTLPYVVQGSQLLLTCLKPIADHLCNAHTSLAQHPAPVPLPAARIEQVWHPRTAEDPLLRWLRGQIKTALGGAAA